LEYKNIPKTIKASSGQEINVDPTNNNKVANSTIVHKSKPTPAMKNANKPLNKAKSSKNGSPIINGPAINIASIAGKNNLIAKKITNKNNKTRSSELDLGVVLISLSI
jgi:hypothetical protein